MPKPDFEHHLEILERLDSRQRPCHVVLVVLDEDHRDLPKGHRTTLEFLPKSETSYEILKKFAEEEAKRRGVEIVDKVA